MTIVSIRECPPNLVFSGSKPRCSAPLEYVRVSRIRLSHGDSSGADSLLPGSESPTAGTSALIYGGMNSLLCNVDVWLLSVGPESDGLGFNAPFEAAPPRTGIPLESQLLQRITAPLQPAGAAVSPRTTVPDTYGCSTRPLHQTDTYSGKTAVALCRSSLFTDIYPAHGTNFHSVRRHGCAPSSATG